MGHKRGTLIRKQIWFAAILCCNYRLEAYNLGLGTLNPKLKRKYNIVYKIRFLDPSWACWAALNAKPLN